VAGWTQCSVKKSLQYVQATCMCSRYPAGTTPRSDEHWRPASYRQAACMNIVARAPDVEDA